MRSISRDGLLVLREAAEWNSAEAMTAEWFLKTERAKRRTAWPFLSVKAGLFWTAESADFTLR